MMLAVFLMAHRIRWVRIVLSAFLLEIAITAVVLPVGMVFGSPLSPTPGEPLNATPYLASAAISCAILGVLFGYWVASKASSRYGVHGLLTGITAMLIYFGLGSLAPGGIPAIVAAYSLSMYVLFNVLRTAGCWIGGLLVARRRAA